MAAPIEQQVNGVENMLYMSSQCTNDGTYTLTVTFKNGVDLNMAQVLVQNRVSLAQPILPDLVKRRGVTVKKKSPSMLMIVNLFSPDDSRDNLYLSNYATIQLKDELSRLAGRRRHHLPRPARLQHAALARSGEDGLAQSDRPATWSRPIEQQNTQVAAGQIGQPPVANGQVFQFTMSTMGRLTDPEQFDEMILKTDADGRIVRAERRGPASSWAPRATTRPARSTASRRWRCRSTSCPAPTPSNIAQPVRAKMEELKGRFPDGRRLRDRLRHHAVHHRIDQRGLQDAARRGHPGGHRGAGVLAELAVGHHSAGRRAGGHHRHLRRHGGDGLQPQQPDAVRPGAGHRHRGRRRDRGGRGGRASHRTRPVAARGDAQGDGTGVRAGDRRRPGADARCSCPARSSRGITGQFFRQFALTIAVSTVISAFNSLTLSPALTALLLRPRDKASGRAAAAAGVCRGGRLAGLGVLDAARGRAGTMRWPAGASADALPWIGAASGPIVGWRGRAGRSISCSAGSSACSIGGFDFSTNVYTLESSAGWLHSQRAGAGGLRRAAGPDLLRL